MASVQSRRYSFRQHKERRNAAIACLDAGITSIPAGQVPKFVRDGAPVGSKNPRKAMDNPGPAQFRALMPGHKIVLVNAPSNSILLDIL